MHLRRRTAPLQGPALGRFLRLTAATLAVVGLLGHGLAMLAVSLLAQPDAAAQTDFPAVLEICAADGLKRTVSSGLPGEQEQKPAGPVSGKFSGCPVCTAFAQAGPADLTTVAVLGGDHVRPAAPRPAHQIAAATPDKLLALSRGPPAA